MPAFIGLTENPFLDHGSKITIHLFMSCQICVSLILVQNVTKYAHRLYQNVDFDSENEKLPKLVTSLHKLQLTTSSSSQRLLQKLETEIKKSTRMSHTERHRPNFPTDNYMLTVCFGFSGFQYPKQVSFYLEIIHHCRR